jgi:hypothetical protein
MCYPPPQGGTFDKKKNQNSVLIPLHRVGNLIKKKYIILYIFFLVLSHFHKGLSRKYVML